ncbi:MAG TPA: polysaccharide biosynthesis/export family protein [Stellaceae bacterium]|jgi:protein involved in polysaccharide export with SLBB domain|nr:polysaccharide biosynthesis/export family protein [Stellaceae bacterium]
MKARSVGEYWQSRVVTKSLALILLTIVVAGVSLAGFIPSARLTSGIQQLSDTWTRLVSTMPSRPSFRSTSHLPAVAPDTAVKSIERVAGSESQHSEVVSHGDRLKVAFFETGGVDLGTSEGNTDQTITVVFPRMDLSGEFTVDDAGSLDVPKLGQVVAAGKSLTALGADLATLYQRVMHRATDVHISFIDRLPVYVVGAVRAAGSFKYLPGMYLMQAIATAGGIDRGTSDTSKAIEDIRETSRYQLEKAKQDRLLIKEAELVAQQTQAASISVPPDIVAKLARAGARDPLTNVVDAARATFKAESENYRQQLALADRQVDVAKMDVDAQKLRLEQLNDLLSKKNSNLQQLQVVAQRGSIPQHRILDVEIEIGELAGRREDFRVAFAQAQRRVIEQQAARAKLERDHFVAIETDLAATRQEQLALNYETTATQAVIETLESGSGTGSAIGGTPRLIITRRVDGQLAVLAAKETTALLPGDVVKVDIANPAAGSFITNAAPSAHLAE